MTTPTIAICASTYNRKPLVQQWLVNLLKHFPPTAYLYIADNGSKDGTKEFLRSVEMDKRITKIIYHDRNIGKAKSMNQLFEIAFKKANVDYFVSSDSDIVVYSDWHNKLLSVYKDLKSKRSGDIGWVSPIYEAENNPIPHNLKEVRELCAKRNGYMDNIVCPGGFIMFPRKMYKEVGGYVINNVYGGIDGSYLHACRKGGYACGFTDRCMVKHLRGGPEYDKYEEWKRSKQKQLRKHGVYNFKITKGFWDV